MQEYLIEIYTPNSEMAVWLGDSLSLLVAIFANVFYCWVKFIVKILFPSITFKGIY